MFKTYLSNQKLILGVIAAVSFIALAAAFFSEAVLNLEPCELCIYQRIPFAIALVIGVIALIIKRYNAAIMACAALFLTNTVIALYHSGVERKWWASALEGCSIPTISDNPQTMLENIMSAPTGNCSEIPWADPLFGLSMANYNVALSLGLCILCVAAGILKRKL